MANGDQYLSGGGAKPVRLAPGNPASVPVFETDAGGSMPVEVVTFEQNPGAMPVRLSRATDGGAMPVRVIAGGGSLIPGATQALLDEGGSFLLLESGDLLLLES